jgi:nitroreductase
VRRGAGTAALAARPVGERRYGPSIDTFLAIASKREVRSFADRPVPEESLERILQAGRVTGSAMNRQPWRFVVLASPEARAALAETVFAPANLTGAPVAVAMVISGGKTAEFDAGRAAQNMMLAAANEDIASTPNGVADRERFAEAVGLAEDERPAIVLSFGYPARPRHVEDRSPEEWVERAARKPLEEIVERL